MTTVVNDPTVASFIEGTNGCDADALAGLFSPDAVVIDDATEYRGTEQIQCWIREHMIAPKITLSVIDFNGTASVLTANAEGDFPGGPLPFQFRFSLGNNSIERLEVTPAS